jgi:threonine/homoserine efflux transporter RhtA
MLKRVAGILMLTLAVTWLMLIWREYVKTENDAFLYAGWVLLFGVLWGYHILLRERATPEAQSKARILGAIIFIPVAAYFVQRLLGWDYPLIEMAAALSVFGLFLSWGVRLFRQSGETI